MAKYYEWSAAMTVESGGYDGEALSILQDGQVLFEGSLSESEVPRTFPVGWRTETSMTGSGTYTYTYRDSDIAQNNRSTMVAITVEDSWSVSINSRNYMTVTVNTRLVSAERTVVGSGYNNIQRHLWMRRDAGGQNFLDVLDDGATAHTIASNISLGSYSFTLAPGENAQRATVYWRNTSHGYEDRPIPNIWTDIINVGVHFRNPLPADYRPGASLKSSSEWGYVSDGVWWSHNRDRGACHVLTADGGSHWQECRTLGGDEGDKGNPPLILLANDVDNQWRNQKLLGKEN